MNIDVKQVAHLSVVKVKDEKIDATVSESFKSKLLDLISQGHWQILLDLTEVRFIDSTGLGVLITVGKQLQMTKDGSFACCNVASTVRKVFDITHLSNFFPIYTDEATALSKIEQKEPVKPPSSEDSVQLFKQLRQSSKNPPLIDSKVFKMTLQSNINESKEAHDLWMLVVIGINDYLNVVDAGKGQEYVESSTKLFNELLEGDSLRGRFDQGQFIFLFKGISLNELEKKIDHFLAGSDYKVILQLQHEELYVSFSATIATFSPSGAIAENVLEYALSAFRSHLGEKSRKSVVSFDAKRPSSSLS